MKINTNNYVEFFIDFFDGNLNDADTALLFTFLDANPDLKAEFDAFEMHTLQPDTQTILENKEELKKPAITLENYQTYLVADLENDLDSHGKQQLDYFIGKNPHAQFEAQLFNKTKLHAGTEVFDQKEKLKRPIVIPFYAQYKYQLAVAAAVAILLLFSQVFFNVNETQNNTATIEEVKTNVIQDKTETATQKLAAFDETLDDSKNAAVLSNKQLNDHASLAIIQKVKTKTVSHVGSMKANNLELKINYVNVELPTFTFIQPEKTDDGSLAIYASVINEVDNPNTEGQLTQLTNNSIGKLTGNAISADSKRTKSGLLKSWKLQAGNFAIAHTKN